MLDSFPNSGYSRGKRFWKKTYLVLFSLRDLWKWKGIVCIKETVADCSKVLRRIVTNISVGFEHGGYW